MQRPASANTITLLNGKTGYGNGTPGVTPATTLDVNTLNAADEELAGFIEAMGITLVNNTYTQLAAAITARLLSGVTTNALVVNTGHTAVRGSKNLGAPGSRQILTAASGTYTTPTDCTAIHVHTIGGGGGGGSSLAVNGAATAGGGGSSGAEVDAWIFGPLNTYAFANGASVGADTSGNPSSFGTSLIVAAGGVKGLKSTAPGAGSVSFAAGGTPLLSGNTVPATGFGTYGNPGGNAVTAYNGNYPCPGGMGASSSAGSGGACGYMTGSGHFAGNNGGYGAGGGGAVAQDGTGAAGGAGGAGITIVDEYY